MIVYKIYLKININDFKEIINLYNDNNLYVNVKYLKYFVN